MVIVRTLPFRLAMVIAIAGFASGTNSFGEPLAAINWGSATNISGDSDVDTTGALVYAYNFGSNSSATTQTVNGVTFSPFVIQDQTTSQTAGSVTISENGAELYSDANVGSATGAFVGLSTAYQGLLSSEVYAASWGTITVDLGGLISGHDYRLQWWTNDSSMFGFAPNYWFEDTTSAGSAGSQTLDSNTSGTVGALGQYVIGSFTATASTASFTLTGGGTGPYRLPLMNALQVRDTTAAVPEIDPTGMGSVLVLVTGALGLLERRRMKTA